MARRRFYRKSRPMRRRTRGYGRRNWKRKVYYRQKRKGSVKRSLSDIPERMFVKLRYVRATEWSCYGNILSCPLILRASLNTPDTRSSGPSDPFSHRPYWSNQLATMYDSYRVYGFKYYITATNTNTNQAFYLATEPLAHGENLETILHTLLERKNSKYRMGGSVNGGHERISLKGYFSTARTQGVSKQQIKNNETDYAATFGTDPAVVPKLPIYIHSTLPDGGTATFDLHVNMTIYAELFNRKEVGSS